MNLLSLNIGRLAKTREACNERMDVGTCRGSFESYYFEKTTGQCQPFRYSGCGGTGNRFHTKEECEELCLRPSRTKQQIYGRPVKPLQTAESPAQQPAGKKNFCSFFSAESL